MKLFYLLVFLVTLSCGSSVENGKTIKIACAANMQFAMDSIIIVFQEEYAIQCEITSGSSGMLTSQIENGAPYDVFISANMNYPETIFANGKGIKPIVYAKGRLLLVTDKNATYSSIDQVLNDTKLQRIAMPDDRIAPYGMATSQYLKNSGQYTKLKDRLVIGESVGQVNQYITTNVVDAAFTSYSFKVKNGNNYTYFEVEQDKFDPIKQGVMILNHGLNNNKKEAEQFLNFISSDKCMAILEYFGYLAN